MGSKWVAATVKKDKKDGKPGSFRNMGKQSDDANDQDADDEQRGKKKRKGAIEQMNGEPQAF